MAIIRGQPYVVRYKAWDMTVSPPVGKTGDANNHTVYVDIDGGASSAISVTITEIDDINRPGEYKFTLPGTYTNGNSIGISIRSTTAGVWIQPITLLTDQGNVESIRSKTDPLQYTSGNVHAVVQAYAAGQSPADLVLATPANKLATDTSGYVTVGGYDSGQSPAEQILSNPSNKLDTDASGRVTVGVNADKTGYTLTTATVDQIVDAVWDESSTGHTTAGTFGYYLDAQVSSRLPNGNVTVGGYAAGMSPSEQVLLTPANKLATDTSGYVTVATNNDKTGYGLTSAQVDAIVDAVWDESQSGHATAGTFGYYLDARVSSRMPSGNVTVGGYATGQSPADLVLVNPSNRLMTDASGHVTVGTNNDKSGYSLSSAGVSAVVDAVWDEAQSGHTTAGTFGYYLDAQVSSRMASGNVTVGGYTSGMSPAEQVLSNPANKLGTDSSGRVVAASVDSDVNLNMAQTVPSSPAANTTGDALRRGIVNLNATVGSRAAPGDQMALVDNAITSSKIATDAIGSDQLASSAVTEIAAAILSTPSNKLVTDASGHVVVGGYAAGQSPAEQVLVNATNRLATDSSGRVTVGVNADKSDYTIDASQVDQIVDAVWDELKSSHNVAGSFGDYLDTKVSSISGGGGSGGGADWTDDEKKQIRYALGLDGVKSAPSSTTGYLPAIKGKTDQLQFTGASVNAAVHFLSSSALGDIANAVWDEHQAGHNTVGTFGYYLDAQVSSRMTGGPVTVGGYATGQNPANYILVNPANKLSTDSSGAVSVSSVSSGAVDSIWNRQRDAVSRPAGSFGYYLDSSISSLVASVASAVWNYAVEGALTAVQWMRLAASVLFGKRIVSGNSIVHRDLSDTKTRVAGTEDAAGNRNVNTLDGS